MDELEKLRKENEDLKDKLTDLTFELNYNKQTELIEFVRELYQSLGNVGKNLTKKELVENLRNYIREFTKNNKIQL
jgi:histidinol phosphatase-like enzyme